MHRAFVVVVLLAFTLPAVAATTDEDDAGLGRDAPDDARDAIAVPLGHHNATHHPYDSDWYLFENLSVDHFFQIGTNLSLLTLHDSDGNVLAHLRWGGTLEIGVPADGRILANFWDYNLPRTYFFHASTSPGSDLSVARLDVSEAPRPRLSETEPSFLVTIDVTNLGPATSRETPWRLDTWATANGGAISSYRLIASGTIPPLSPGESHRIEAAWDTTGQVGEFPLQVRLFAAVDLAARDNALTERVHVGPEALRGVALGIDALNVRFGCFGPYSNGHRHSLGCDAPGIDDEPLPLP